MSIFKFSFNKKSTINISSNNYHENGNKEENVGNKKYDYIPLHILGSGSYGIILTVKSKINDKIYVMKILNKDDNNNKYSKIEILLLKYFNHQNIVKYITDFEDNKNYYIVMEYIKGQNLFDLYMSYQLQKKIIEEKKISKILSQCLEALDYIHGEGIIHRDIKPLNIMIDEKMNVKIIDFNTSAIMDPSAAKKFTDDPDLILLLLNHGTKVRNCFEAPETQSLNYNQYYNAKVDVCSLGNTFSIFIYNNFFNNSDSYSIELKNIIDLMKTFDENKRPTINEIYKNFMSNYYSNKYIKCSSIFSSLYCLYNYPIWADYFKKNEIIKEKEKEISKFFFYTLKKSKSNHKHIYEDIITFMKKNLKLLSTNKNDESQEIFPISFIHFIMSKLNEELNLFEEKQNHIDISRNNEKDKAIYYYVDNYKNNISSVISENFLGILLLRRTCECGKKTYECNYFYYLSFNMDFLIKENIKLYDDNIFNALLKNKIKRYYFCEKCKEFVKHEEVIKLFNVPKNFIIFFDRRIKNTTKKINIDFKEK